ncbi:MAG: guanylate kinase [Pseudomonadota bacterium]
MPERTGQLFVVSAPSGAGKTSLVKALLERDPRVRMSVSYTTRKARSTEVDGQDYFFVTQERFLELRDAGEMLEHAEVFGNFYGTGRGQVQALLTDGHHVILEIDWQGARQVRDGAPKCRSVFILPPSRTELERRLRQRKTDTDEVIARRLGESLSDMTHWAEFDYVLVNDDFNEAVDALAAIVNGQGEDHAGDAPAVQAAARKVLDS